MFASYWYYLFLALASACWLFFYIQSEDPVAYKLASEFIKRTSSSLEPYLQMVRCNYYNIIMFLVIFDQ